MNGTEEEFPLPFSGNHDAQGASSSEAVGRVAELFGLESQSVLLAEALTHPSYAHEVPEAQDNQRLEFLGDAVLGLCVSHELIERLSGAQEGKLTRTRAQIVSTGALAAFARTHRIAEAIRFGKGAEQSDLCDSAKVLADVVEALIAACFLDHGLEAARVICRRLVEAGLDGLRAGARDAKSELQEQVQALRLPAPTYRVVQQSGPAHRTEFVVDVVVDEQAVARGRGRSRRAAETAAARRALDSGDYRIVPQGNHEEKR